MVRFVFWSAVAIGFIWLVKTSVETADDYKCVEQDYVVQQYDTLWGIAERFCDGNIEVAVDDLVSARGSATVIVGQVVEIRNND